MSAGPRLCFATFRRVRRGGSAASRFLTILDRMLLSVFVLELVAKLVGADVAAMRRAEAARVGGAGAGH
jgi:hypothetical protein